MISLGILNLPPANTPGAPEAKLRLILWLEQGRRRRRMFQTLAEGMVE